MTLSTCAVCKEESAMFREALELVRKNGGFRVYEHLREWLSLQAVPIAAHSGERPRLMLIRGGLEEKP